MRSSGHLHYAVLVAYVELRFGAQIGEKFGEEVSHLVLVHLFQGGHPLPIHLDYSCGSCGRLVFEERAQTAASAATAGVRMLGDDSAFRGLYENPARPLERYLE